MIGAGPPERKDGSVDVPGTQCRGAWGTQAEMQRNGDVRVGPHGTQVGAHVHARTRERSLRLKPGLAIGGSTGR